jgi:Icc-related predicted phosphoesterase
MKIQILSDLHVDVLPIKRFSIVEAVDAVIVAGDTCEGALRAFEHLRRIVPMHIPILMVMGNHEFYRRFIRSELALARSHAPTFNIHLLENETVVLGGAVRFVGATLWSDYSIFGEANRAAVMSVCAAGMNDHKKIGWQKQPWRRFRPQEAALLHFQSRDYLEAVLARRFDGPTVAISHHAVHMNSVPPEFKNNRLTAAYVSDLSMLIERYQPTLFVHGHVHHSSDYRVGKTRIICNPHGYGFENPNFNGNLVVEIDEGRSEGEA